MQIKKYHKPENVEITVYMAVEKGINDCNIWIE